MYMYVHRYSPLWGKARQARVEQTDAHKRNIVNNAPRRVHRRHQPCRLLHATGEKKLWE